MTLIDKITYFRKLNNSYVEVCTLYAPSISRNRLSSQFYDDSLTLMMVFYGRCDIPYLLHS